MVRSKYFPEIEREVARKAVKALVIAIIILAPITLLNIFSSNYIIERGIGESIEFSDFSPGFGPFTEEGYLLFRNSGEWRNFVNLTYRSSNFRNYNESQMDFLIDQSIHRLNFSKSVYFGAFWGTRSSGGYSIEILDITLIGRSLNVFIRRTEPGPFEMVILIITHPYHMVKMDKMDIPTDVELQVNFLGDEFTYLCPIGIMIFLTLVLVMVALKGKNRR
jgi:hypothetical protein